MIPNNKPLYLQLKETLIERIKSGDYLENDVIPGERTLAEMYNVSRTTVRKCIGILVEEGYITRSNGRLIVMNDRKISHRLGDLLGIRGELLEISNKIRVIELFKGYETVHYEVKRYLELGNINKVYKFVRLFIVEDKPILVNYSYIAPDKGKLIEDIDLNDTVIYTYLESCGYKISYAEQKISSGVCTTKQSKDLDYAEGNPILVRKRTTYLEGGSPIIYDENIYRGDSYQYRIKLLR